MNPNRPILRHVNIIIKMAKVKGRILKRCLPATALARWADDIKMVSTSVSLSGEHPNWFLHLVKSMRLVTTLAFGSSEPV